MKKDIILLLLFIIPGISNGDPVKTGILCQQAKNLIEEAQQEDKTDLLNSSTIEKYKKAWDLCPDAFSCSDIRTLGYSYYLNKKYFLAIKFLSKAEKCEKDNKIKEIILISLSESYRETKNYNSAIIYAKKALKKAYTVQIISSCYYTLAHIYQDQDMHQKAIKYFQKDVKSYLKDRCKTDKDVMQGKVRDLILGDTYMLIASEYDKLNDQNKVEKYYIKAALCGDYSAIEKCNKLGLRYKIEN
jgi:tetratricopeptide (TPR) repeat protein